VERGGLVVFESKISMWYELIDRAKHDGLLTKKNIYGKVVGGVIPSPPDDRDWSLFMIARVPTKVPDSVSFDYLVPEVLDQGPYGTCVAKTNTTAMGMGFNYQERLPEGGFSTLYNYLLCKQNDGLPDEEGTFPRISCKIAQKYGNLQRKHLPYSFSGQPEVKDWMYEHAAGYKLKAYARLNGLEEIEQALAAGKIVRISILVADNFVNWDGRGLIGPPQGRMLGFHEMALSTYDRKGGFLRGPNSWGRKWGKDGFYELSYEFCEWELSDIPNFPALREAWAVEFEEYLTPETVIEMWIDKSTATVNGKEVYIDPDNPKVRPFIVPEWGRTVGPYRFIAENLGAKVVWDEKKNKVTIYK